MPGKRKPKHVAPGAAEFVRPLSAVFWEVPGGVSAARARVLIARGEVVPTYVDGQPWTGGPVRADGRTPPSVVRPPPAARPNPGRTYPPSPELIGMPQAAPRRGNPSAAEQQDARVRLVAGARRDNPQVRQGVFESFFYDYSDNTPRFFVRGFRSDRAIDAQALASQPPLTPRTGRRLVKEYKSRAEAERAAEKLNIAFRRSHPVSSHESVADPAEPGTKRHVLRAFWDARRAGPKTKRAPLRSGRAERLARAIELPVEAMPDGTYVVLWHGVPHPAKNAAEVYALAGRLRRGARRTNPGLYQEIRLTRRSAPNRRISTPLQAVAVFLVEAEHRAQESFWVLALNTQRLVVAAVEVYRGTINSTLVHPREVFGVAVAASADAVIVVHNHPSGDPTPSPEDFALTRRLKEVGRLMAIEVLDSLVVGQQRWTAITAEGTREGGALPAIPAGVKVE